MMATSRVTSICWQEYVSIRGRFQRSVHLERDAGDYSWLDGYVVTPLVQSLTRRIAAGLAPDGRSRAWSITGPYGSGKSAYALFLSHLLGNPKEGEVKKARKLLSDHAKPDYTSLFGRQGMLAGTRGLVPVRATGERKSFDLLLLEALGRTAEEFWSGPGTKPDVFYELSEAIEEAREEGHVDTGLVVALYEEVASKIADSNHPGDGILVLLDEAGKPLEEAASQSSDGDIFVLQELAEAASRSGGAPIVFVVLLHQAFEHYVNRTNTLQRNEWAKVQGRFEDLPFQEAEDQVLHLIGKAIDRGGSPSASFKKKTKAQVSATIKALPKEAGSPSKLRGLLGGTTPLHPVTALALGPLFRSRLAQNERSLFAFLSGIEPRGFQEFLAKTAGTIETPLLFPVDGLFDYVQAAFSGRLYGRNGRLWAQIESALRRLPSNASRLDARVVKAIGILSALSDISVLRPSDEILAAALCEPGVVSRKQLQEVLKRLRDDSVIVHRKYRDAYQLWEGSDLDLDLLVQSADRSVSQHSALLKRLTKAAPPRPLVAKRHLFETGTLRYFGVYYTDESVADGTLDCPDEGADGVVWLAIPSNDAARGALIAQLTQEMVWLRRDRAKDRPAIVGVPRNAERLRELAAELAALEWVQTNTVELRDDPAARRELAGRLLDAEITLQSELRTLLSSSVACDWFYDGQRVTIRSSRGLIRYLSEVCDEVYRSAPHIHNELLNRSHLSSAAAAARRLLMTAMVENADQERLGITGNPPEYSMYRSLLERHGVHRESESGWAIAAPRGRKQGSLTAAWKGLQQSLDETEAQRIPFDELVQGLKRPPFGIKDGVLPVLLLAAILEGQDEIAMYEENAFVPDITPAVVERLIRSPGRFEIQRFRISGARLSVFEKLSGLLTKQTEPDKRSILPVVRQLVRFATRLPEYTRNTRNISDVARQVREALLRAREPAPLLFKQLPLACGFKPFDAKKKRAGKEVDEYIQALKSALRELNLAYLQLLDEVERLLIEAFSLPQNVERMRSELCARSQRLLAIAADTELKGFLLRSSDEMLAREDWLVSVATHLGGKPPQYWRDVDLDQARLKTGLIRKRFGALEALVIDNEGEIQVDGTQLLRVAVTEPGVKEHERVVVIREEDTRLLDSFRQEVMTAVQSGKASLPLDAVLAGIVLATRDIIEELNADQAEPATRKKETRQ